MKRKFNVINYIVTFVFTVAFVVLAVLVFQEKYALEIKSGILYFIIGMVLSGFFCALIHELGHLLFGKANGFVLSSFTVWFFRWAKQGKKLKFFFTFSLDEAGSTEMIKKNTNNLKKGLKNMTVGGLIFSFISLLFGVPVLFLQVPYWLYCILVTFLPIGAYFFVGNLLPASEGGARNDGGVLYGLKKGDDETKVTLSLLAIQSELYNGKTFSEIDEKYFFDLPQLPEDSLNFITLLNYRYNYYLDKGDFENAKKTTDRLLTLEEYMPKHFIYAIKTDALYNACTFDFNDKVADDLMYELENQLNKDKSPTSYRVRLAYILAITGEKEMAELFYKRALKVAKKCHLSGLKRFETNLIEDLKEKYKD